MSEAVFSWTKIGEVSGGCWLRPPAAGTAGVSGVYDDSRAVRPGSAFVATVGTLTDGHRYLPDAIRNGAAAVLVEQPPAPAILEQLQAAGCACLQVAAGLHAFQQLARAYRDSLSGLQVVGITGSCGKTSSKEMCAAVLAQAYPGQVHKTPGNANNHYGLPRTMLEMPRQTRLAVLEMGSNHPGEIAALAALARPTIGLVCNIGPAHLEFFHDLQGVAEEKGEMLAGTAADGVAIYPYEAAGVETLRRKAGRRRQLTFGTAAAADVRCTYLGQQADGTFGLRLDWRASGDSRVFNWPVGGAHQALNAAAATAVGTAAGIDPDRIVLGLQACALPGQRMQLLEADGAVWANDAYNSNPASCLASLHWFAEVSAPAVARILVLGEMRELGEANSPAAHAEIFTAARQLFPHDRIIAVGGQTRAAADRLGLEYFADVTALRQAWPARLPAGCWVLLKGSNGVRLYELAP